MKWEQPQGETIHGFAFWDGAVEEPYIEVGPDGIVVGIQRIEE